MQAVIMAGGKGTRLAAVAKDIPKPMVSVNGKPLLEYQIENLKDSGITDIIMVVGHMSDAIIGHFGDGSSFGVNIRYFKEDQPLGTAGAFHKILEWLEDVFVLVFGDVFLDVDFARMIGYHNVKGAFITLFSHPNAHPYDSDILIDDENGKVVGWQRKGQERAGVYKNLVNAGIYVISKAALSFLPDINKIDLERDLIEVLLCQNVVYAYHSTEYVKDIGTPERFVGVEADYRSGIPSARNLKCKQKCIFLDRDGTVNKYVGFLHDIKQMELAERAAAAIRKINASGYLAIIITNQPVVARGEVTSDELREIHNKLETLLGKEGAYVDGIYFCPHHPDGGFQGEVAELKVDCPCRKPKIGLVEQAVRDFNIDVNASWMVGDTWCDMETGQNAGLHTALLESGSPKKGLMEGCRPEMRASDLFEAVEEILGTDNKEDRL